MSGAHLKAHLRRADSRNARTKSQTRGVVLTALYENSEHEKSLRDQLKIRVGEPRMVGRTQTADDLRSKLDKKKVGELIIVDDIFI